MEAIQKCMNKLLRVLNNSRISDKISTKSMLTKFNLLSVNQMNAQIKLTEIWKSVNILNYPIKTLVIQRGSEAVSTRAMTAGVLEEVKITNSSEKTFLNDAIHIWNRSSVAIKDCVSISSAKKAIKAFVVTLPV